MGLYAAFPFRLCLVQKFYKNFYIHCGPCCVFFCAQSLSKKHVKKSHSKGCLRSLPLAKLQTLDDRQPPYSWTGFLTLRHVHRLATGIMPGAKSLTVAITDVVLFSLYFAARRRRIAARSLISDCTAINGTGPSAAEIMWVVRALRDNVGCLVLIVVFFFDIGDNRQQPTCASIEGYATLYESRYRRTCCRIH
jgi:hypothetical protein